MCQRARNRIMRVQRAGDQTAAMKINEPGQHLGVNRRILPHAQGTARPRQGSFLYPVNSDFGSRKFHESRKPRAPLLNRCLSSIARIARRKELQEAIDAWVERHQRLR
jgi:hypothetical protein